MIHAPRRTRPVARPTLRLAAIVGACLLIVLGFLLDGTTEPGHHAALIIGGLVAGLGIRG